MDAWLLPRLNLLLMLLLLSAAAATAPSRLLLPAGVDTLLEDPAAAPAAL
jgi:hypothetical protein